MKRKPRKKISNIKKILTDHKIKISKLAEKLLLLGIKRIALINGYTLFKPTFSRCFNTISIISLFVLLSITSAEAQNARHMFNPKIDTLFVASEPDYPPFCIVDEKGNADGFSVDLIKVVAEVMHLHVQVKVGPWAEIKQELVEGKIDALPLVGRSPEREEVYDFTFPYHTMNGAVFVRNGTKDIKTLNDLKQKDIVVMKGDNAHEFVKRVKLSGKIHSTETYNIAFQELSEGKYDAVIAQKLMGLQLLNDMNINNVKALDVILTDFNQDFSFAVQEGDRELLSILNEGLSIIIANGTYNELHKKWWTPITIRGLSLKEKLIMILPYIISIIFIITIIAIIILRSQVKKRTRNLVKEITVRKNAEESLKNSRERLKTATSILRHDIKNDLVVIKSAVSIYRKGLDESMLDEIEKRVKKSLNIIDNNHKQEAFIDSNADLGEYDLREAISVVVKNYPDLEINISGDGKVNADTALYSVIENIISNAIKHGETTKLDIDIRCDKEFCQIRFADYGTGIPDKIKDRIFEEGFIYGETGHTGIGLFIAKQTVESYDGKIYVENNDPTGAIFVVKLRSVV